MATKSKRKYSSSIFHAKAPTSCSLMFPRMVLAPLPGIDYFSIEWVCPLSKTACHSSSAKCRIPALIQFRHFGRNFHLPNFRKLIQSCPCIVSFFFLFERDFALCVCSTLYSLLQRMPGWKRTQKLALMAGRSCIPLAHPTHGFLPSNLSGFESWLGNVNYPLNAKEVVRRGIGRKCSECNGNRGHTTVASRIVCCCCCCSCGCCCCNWSALHTDTRTTKTREVHFSYRQQRPITKVTNQPHTSRLSFRKSLAPPLLLQLHSLLLCKCCCC